MIQPLQIRNLTIPNNLILAPMAGVADGPFRLICQELGAGLTISELASAKGILLKTRQTLDMIRFQGQLRPYGVQIFGVDADAMAEAARTVEGMGICDLIDINMGCPVSKVVKTGAGAALMKTPAVASKIIGAVRGAVKMPVTVKCRIGWNSKQINVREFVKMAIDQGADAVTVHARTKEDGYSGTASWETLENLQVLCGSIPFIANGDLHTTDDLKKIQEISGCRGFMIGRGAVGRPWIFSELLHECGFKVPAKDRQYPKSSTNGTLLEGVPATDGAGLLGPPARWEIFRRHLVEMLMEHASKGVCLFRVHLFNYLRGHPNASQMRRAMCDERDPNTVLRVGKDFFLGGESA